MREHIYNLLSEALPAVDFEADFLFGELDSLSIVTIFAILAKEYGVSFDALDVTPKNFKSLDSIVKMVESKMDNR
ncbi:MAG: acyl carrier protein [Alistipes sp.]|nr:acyl carrier protein [Alistipes sp.]